MEKVQEKQLFGTALDRRGKRYNRLTAIAPVEAPAGGKRDSLYWQCLCDCGTTKVVNGGDLASGRTRSCGSWPFVAKSTQARHSNDLGHTKWPSNLRANGRAIQLGPKVSAVTRRASRTRTPR